MFRTWWIRAAVVSASISSWSCFGGWRVAERFESPDGNFSLRIPKERAGISVEQGSVQGGRWLVFVADNSRRRFEWYPVPRTTAGLLRGSAYRDVFLSTFFDDYVVPMYEAENRVAEQLHGALVGSGSERSHYAVLKLQRSPIESREEEPRQGTVLLAQTLVFIHGAWCYVVTLTELMPDTDSLNWDIRDVLALRNQMMFK